MWQNDRYFASILEKLNACNLFIIPINYDLKPLAILPAVYSNLDVEYDENFADLERPPSCSANHHGGLCRIDASVMSLCTMNWYQASRYPRPLITHRQKQIWDADVTLCSVLTWQLLLETIDVIDKVCNITDHLTITRLAIGLRSSSRETPHFTICFGWVTKLQNKCPCRIGRKGTIINIFAVLFLGILV